MSPAERRVVKWLLHCASDTWSQAACITAERLTSAGWVIVDGPGYVDAEDKPQQRYTGSRTSTRCGGERGRAQVPLDVAQNGVASSRLAVDSCAWCVSGGGVHYRTRTEEGTSVIADLLAGCSVRPARLSSEAPPAARRALARVGRPQR